VKPRGARSVTPGFPGHGWTIPLCRGVGGTGYDIVSEGASAQGEASWVAPGVTSRGAIPRTALGPKLCLNVASIHLPHHQTCTVDSFIVSQPHHQTCTVDPLIVSQSVRRRCSA